VVEVLPLVGHRNTVVAAAVLDSRTLSNRYQSIINSKVMEEFGLCGNGEWDDVNIEA